ncbi:MAG: sporulation protein [Bacteroidales bacterium]|nr:sporulation protein [Bacteroidales bacterium]
METNFEQVLKNFSEQLKGFASTQTVVGEEFEFGGYRCKPVINVGLGYGGGNGEGEDHRHKGKGKGTGAAGGIGISPVGFLAVKGDEITFIPATNKKGLGSVLEKVPDLIEKVMEMKEKKEKAEKDKTGK